MELIVAPEMAVVLRDQISPQEALQRADAAKLTAFGSLNKLFFRPKDGDIELGTVERRLDSFWHVKARADYAFQRRARFRAPVSSAEVKQVTINGIEGKLDIEEMSIPLEGIEHCEALHERELFLDGVTGQPKDYALYLSFPATPIEDLLAFQPEGILVVPPQKRASMIVRQLLGEMMKPFDADVIHREVVEVDPITLYFRPTYAFEFVWPSKQKRGILEVDGLTGAVRTDGQQFGGQIGKYLTPEVLFDIGIDAVDLFVPGGGIALKVGRALVQRNDRNK